jgi:hypothetical protein
MSTGPTAEALRNEPTRLERLETPIPPPMAPLPVAETPAAPESVEANINARIEAIRRPGPGR